MRISALFHLYEIGHIYLLLFLHFIYIFFKKGQFLNNHLLMLFISFYYFADVGAHTKILNYDRMWGGLC